MAGPHHGVRRGAIAGLLGATVVALWFLIVDAIQGEPLFTPRFLAAVLFRTDPVAIDAGRLVAFTAFHYAVFVLIGIGAGAGLRRLPGVPGILLGLVVGVLFFDVMFYTSVVLTGIHIVRLLGWAEVLIANVLAGVVIMAYLDISRAIRARTWLDALRQHPRLREGAAAGAIGALLVAAWFLLIDLFQRQAFFTPAALGSAILYGARGVAEVQITATTVILYSFIHVAVFVVAGLVAVALVSMAEREPRVLFGAILLFVTFEVFFVGITAIAASWLLDALGWENVLIGNAIAAAGIGIYLWRRHPALGEAIRETQLEEAA